MGFNLKSILPYLAGAGASGLSSQFSALAPFSAAIGAGAGALTGKNPLSGALAGFTGGGVGSTLAGGIKGAFSGAPGSNPLDNFGSGAMTGLKSFGNSIPGFGGIGTDNPTGMFAKFLTPGASQNNVLQNGTQYYKPNGSGTGYNPTGLALPNSTPAASIASAPTPAGAVAGAATSKMNPMGMFKSMLPGLATAGIGGLLAPTPAAPDYSAIKNDLITKAQTGGDPAARAAALNQYMSTLNAPTGASAEAGVANAKLINDRQKADALKQIQDQFSANNGSLEGNSAYNNAVTKSNAAYDQNYSAQAAQTQFQYDQAQQAQKMAAADALRGMDDTQLQFYASLANLDVMQIQQQFQLDAGRAQGLKDLATQAGSLMMEKSLGLNGGVK